MPTRRQSHAGSWYSANPVELARELDEYLDHPAASTFSPSSVKCIIAPHAGYRYSGRTAGYAYAQLRREPPPTTTITRVYILGPVHHMHCRGVGLLSLADKLETPFGELLVDTLEQQDLIRACPGLFQQWPSLKQEEDEHSLEMHLPFVHRVLQQQQQGSSSSSSPHVRVVPIAVGQLSTAAQQEMGREIWRRAAVDNANNSLIIISTDFCHWGERFSYQNWPRPDLPLHASIEALDREAMQIIARQDYAGFQDYLHRTRNTICGRQPLLVLLAGLQQQGEEQYEVRFLHYEQSSQCATLQDSSVSYAAAVVVVEVSSTDDDE